MNEKELKEQLKLSKTQNNGTRYNYIAKSFNSIDYAMELEKYIIKILKENQQLKEQIEYLRRSIERKEETIIDLRVENGLDKSEKEIIDYLKEQMNSIEIELIMKSQNDYELGKLQGYYKFCKEILSKIEKSDK